MTSPALRALQGVSLALALALVLVLARQNQALADRAAKLQKRSYEPYAGLYVPTTETRTVDGAAIALGEHPLAPPAA